MNPATTTVAGDIVGVRLALGVWGRPVVQIRRALWFVLPVLQGAPKPDPQRAGIGPWREIEREDIPEVMGIFPVEIEGDEPPS